MTILHNLPFLHSFLDIITEVSINILSYWGLTKRIEPDKNKTMNGQTVIVTGGNRGLGEGVVRDLVERGARVIIACRDIEKARQLVLDIETKDPQSASRIRIVKLDLASFESVKIFAKDILESEPNIDILINNAGIVDVNIIETVDKIERTLQVNYLSHVLLTFLLLDRIRESKYSKIIFIGSLAHHRRVDIDLVSVKESHMDRYTISKVALTMFARKLSGALNRNQSSEKTSRTTRVFVVDPGMSITEIMKESFESSFAKSWLVQQLFRKPIEGSNAIIFSIISNDDYNAEEFYWKDGVPKLPNKIVYDEKIVEKVLIQTDQLLNDQFDSENFVFDFLVTNT